MKLRSVFALLLILNMLFLTGCWDYKDYDNLALVAALGIDADEMTNEVTVTVEYYIPGGGGGNAGGGQGKKSTSQNMPNSGAVVAKGSTVTEAVAKIQEARRKELFYSYMEVIVLGESAAKTITKQVVQFFDRTPNIRSSVYIVFTKGKAEDVLSTLDPNISVTPARAIHEMIDQSTKSGSSFPVTIEDFAEKLAISGVEPSAPQVTVAITEQGSSPSSETASEEGPVKFSKMKDGYQEIDGTAAFQGDQLVGWLDKTESTGLGYIINKNLTPFESVDTTSENNTETTLELSVVKAKSKIKASLEGESPVISITTNVQADLQKYTENIEYDSLTPDALSLMESQLSEQIKSEIEAAIEKGQKEFKADIFGFGFEFYRKYPSLWHNQYEVAWQELFPTIQVNVSVKAKIINTGTNVKKFNIH